MQFKKSFAFILSAFMMLSSVNVSASAEVLSHEIVDEVSPAYEIARTVENTLAISSSTAECTSICTGSSSVVNVSVEHTLQKFWGLWVWNDVDGASWTKTKSGSSISLVSTKSGLSSGTYRVKSVFTLTSSNGETETITVYSTEKSC